MTGIAEDHDAAIELVRDEWRKLRGHNPNSPLLKYASNVTDSGFDECIDAKDRIEFNNLFAADEPKYVAVILGRYFVALRNAVDSIEGIDRRPKPRASEQKSYWDDSLPDAHEDSEIPF